MLQMLDVYRMRRLINTTVWSKEFKPYHLPPGESGKSLTSYPQAHASLALPVYESFDDCSEHLICKIPVHFCFETNLRGSPLPMRTTVLPNK